jgi:hypothetical protein
MVRKSNYKKQDLEHPIAGRITLGGLFHEAFHLFTHLDRGFLLTAKQLLVAPGAMQRSYIAGDRSRHQKPFSMFFICATIAALTRYWIFSILIKNHDLPNTSEVAFIRDYMVVFHVALLPLYALITWLFFKRSGYNYAEFGVMNLYTMSFLFIMVSFISLFKLIWPMIDTARIELPIYAVYGVITFCSFFHTSNKWIVGSKALIMVLIQFQLIQLVEDLAIRYIS